jgi:hypothetical protein
MQGFKASREWIAHFFEEKQPFSYMDMFVLVTARRSYEKKKAELPA